MSHSCERRFAFVVNADVPIASWKVLELLKEQFPQHEVDVIHVAKALKSSPVILAAAALEALMRHPRVLVSGRAALRDAIFRTVTVARFVRGLASRTVSAETHDFVFQMQSLWSAHVAGVPHFIYTDHTYLTHESYPVKDTGVNYGTAYLARERSLYHRATAIFTRSQNVTRDLLDRYDVSPSNVVCVYAGANTDARAVDTANSVAEREPKCILFVGQDWERKGGPDLVDAFQIVTDVHPDATLKIIGCCPKDLPQHSGISVLGRLPNHALTDHYLRAGVFCMPSLREPFGIVFIEAMSFGLPLIGTEIGAVPDFVRPDWNGYLVPAGNPEKIADALCAIWSDTAKVQKFGARSLSLARERYNWPTVVDKMTRRIRREVDV